MYTYCTYGRGCALYRAHTIRGRAYVTYVHMCMYTRGRKRGRGGGLGWIHGVRMSGGGGRKATPDNGSSRERWYQGGWRGGGFLFGRRIEFMMQHAGQSHGDVTFSSGWSLVACHRPRWNIANLNLWTCMERLRCIGWSGDGKRERERERGCFSLLNEVLSSHVLNIARLYSTIGEGEEQTGIKRLDVAMNKAVRLDWSDGVI